MSNIALLTTVSFIAFMASGIIGPVTSLYMEFLGASYAIIGLLGTVTALTAILLSYVWGRASDYLGRRKMFLVGGLLAMAASNGLMAVVPGFGYLFPLRILGGAALSAFTTSSLALMGDALERHTGTRGRRMGVYRGLSSLGFGLMAFLSGSIADSFSLRVPFALSALLYFVAVLVALAVKEQIAPNVPRKTPGISSFLRLLSRAPWDGVVDIATKLRTAVRSSGDPGKAESSDMPNRADTDADTNAGTLPLAQLLISAFLWSLVIGAVYAVWANYMVSDLKFSPTAMSRLWSLASLSEFPLMIIAGWLSDRTGRLPMLALGFAAWALVFAGYVLVPVMPWIIFVQLTRGFAYSAYTATAMTYATEVRSRAKRGEVSGLYNATGGLGSILGASMGGVQAQLMGLRVMIGTNSAIIFGGALYLTGVIFRRKISGKATT